MKEEEAVGGKPNVRPKSSHQFVLRDSIRKDHRRSKKSSFRGQAQNRQRISGNASPHQPLSNGWSMDGCVLKSFEFRISKLTLTLHDRNLGANTFQFAFQTFDRSAILGGQFQVAFCRKPGHTHAVMKPF